MHEQPRAMYFDTAFGPVFAWYHRPAEPTIGLGIVLCPPIGSELMCSYHPLRELAHTIASSGIAVLRADYHGTGDASGRDDDPNRVAAWLATIDESVNQLRSLGCDRIGLVGLRLGATLAAVVASRRSDIVCTVLWAPLKSGKAYVREMKMLAQTEASPIPSKQDVPTEDRVEAGGFLLSKDTLAELAAIDLTDLPQPSSPALLINRDDIASSNKLVAALNATQVDWPGYAKLMLAPHYATSTPETFARIAAWLASTAERTAMLPTPVQSENEPDVELAGEVRERAIRFGPDNRLFGVLAEPLASKTRTTAIVLPNMGANHHVGPNRMYVRVARQWAALGFSVLRFDLGGVGESAPGAGQPLNAPYSDHGIDDFERGVAEIRRRTAAAHIVAIGLCSGAYIAFHAGLRGSSMSSQILVNPQAFYWKEGTSLDAAPAAVAGQAQAYGASMRRWASWKKLLTGRAKYRALALTFGRRIRDRGTTWVKRAATQLGLLVPVDDLAHDLRIVAERGISTLIIFSENDAGIAYLKERAGGETSRQIRNGRLTIETIAQADHTFTSQASQTRLIEAMTSYLAKSA